jgi:hypothetical protein
MTKRSLPTDFKVLVAMVVLLVVPFALTLRTIAVSRPLMMDLKANPSPRGYTWSLSLFIVPVLALTGWLWQRKYNLLQKRAFWLRLRGAGFFWMFCLA